MNKFTSMLAGISMLVIASGASAEPVTLTAAQMDGVNAGALKVDSLPGFIEITLPIHSTITVSKLTTITLPPFLEITLPVK